ncbi:MAG: acyl-CoA dehydrogenase family protein [Chloroflexi bacterium]|nr:acyl-CoA dehydrogenase family protein [Chloroflexota bacterium]MBK6710098.1 acyl-CoA dehydrogenase family protein [Chloroflexota bacterium]MBK7179733.1 acyl-CoA dehydrogenase family protein [Chloroflexota bacterium]MBK7919883.1 acyl-CoA dehydrogenase family protein [Chloroflexota bacterium]MBK8935131.1 acyl-CoA dehydrogenase family protein [Chloroflexota bacterium]
MSFGLTEEQREIQLLAREFAKNEIAPKAEHYDKSHEYPWPVIKKAQELGLTTMSIPEEYGGLGLSLLEECVVTEELAWGCSGMSTAMGVNGLAILPILIAGTEEQKQAYCGRLAGGEMSSYCLTEPEAGSDVAGIKTTARKEGDHYILNGSKTFITGATVANFFTVFAYTDPGVRYKGMSCFVVEREWEGVSVGQPFDKLGQHASDTAEVVFDNVRVPETHRLGAEGTGFITAMKVFDRSRPATAAGALGVARRALEESIKYAKERISMGKEIWQYQAIGHKIADMAMDLEAARLLVWKSAWAVDNGQPDTMVSSFGKAFAADAAMKIATDAVQVFGGYGYMSEYPVEKLMRDAKIFQIYEGTSQIQRNIVVRELFRK